MKRILRSLVAVATLAACGGSTGGELIKSDKQRLAATAAPDADVQQAARDNAMFAFTLYHQVGSTPGNLFFSPFSVSQALAMTSVGARGTTASEMNQALRFMLPSERLHPAFNAIDLALASRADSGKSQDGKGPFQLRTVNGLWARKGLNLEAPFLDTLAADYGAGVRVLDFAKNPESARSEINAWVSDQTSGKISELLGRGTIDADTRLVLANAVYFNAAWAKPFEKSATHDAAFHKLDGSSKSVPTMHGSFEGLYAHADDADVVEIPYSNPDVALDLIVPAPGEFAAVESSLYVSDFESRLAGMTGKEVVLDLPKFRVQTALSLVPALKALGMQAAFTPAADFSGIDGKPDLMITDVVHQAFVNVDENGTEAAAATGVILGPTAMPEQVQVSVDRPFILVLRDRPTHTVLFVGRVVDPG